MKQPKSMVLLCSMPYKTTQNHEKKHEIYMENHQKLAKAVNKIVAMMEKL